MVGAYLKKEENIDWNPVYQRVRCNGNIVNLAVRAFLYDLGRHLATSSCLSSPPNAAAFGPDSPGSQLCRLWMQAVKPPGHAQILWPKTVASGVSISRNACSRR